VWASMQSGNASTEQKQEFARVCLSVLGKNIAVKDEHKEVLKDALTQTVLGMVSAEKRPIVTGSDKKEAAAAAAAAIELSPEGFDPLRYDLLPYSLLSSPSEKLSDELPAIMELYLVHNQSFLTDFRFLGFPFHYWYTAQFLLILFVVLCLIYAYQTDRSNEKYNFPDE
ncbi:DUF4212 domain-containing protein, partial [bacterium]|nr:DUF4212 domain-containing protein [bacterium]